MSAVLLVHKMPASLHTDPSIRKASVEARVVDGEGILPVPYDPDYDKQFVKSTMQVSAHLIPRSRC